MGVIYVVVKLVDVNNFYRISPPPLWPNLIVLWVVKNGQGTLKDSCHDGLKHTVAYAPNIIPDPTRDFRL